MSEFGHYDFSNMSTLYQDTAMTNPVTTDGQTIAAVFDLSGKGNHLIQATAGERPTFKTNVTSMNGQSAALFDGGDRLVAPAMFTTNQAEFSVFFIGKRTATAVTCPIWEFGSVSTFGPHGFHFNAADALFANLVGGDGSRQANGQVTAGVPYRFEVTGNATVGRMFKNGAQIATDFSPITGLYSVGNSGYDFNLCDRPQGGFARYDGHVGEVSVWNNYFSDADVLEYDWYLSDKWIDPVTEFFNPGTTTSPNHWMTTEDPDRFDGDLRYDYWREETRRNRWQQEERPDRWDGETRPVRITELVSASRWATDSRSGAGRWREVLFERDVPTSPVLGGDQAIWTWDDDSILWDDPGVFWEGI